MPHKVRIEGIIGIDVDVKDIREQLGDANGRDVVAEIASPGGFMSEGLKMYNELKNYQGNVDTHLTGIVASLGTYVAMVGKHRTAEKNAVFMIHNGSGIAMGDYRVMFKFGNRLNSATNMIAKEYVAKTGTALAKIRAAMDKETFYFGDEIKDAGFVHEMVGDAEPEDKAEAVAFAELMFDECQSKINTPELIKKDMKALSTMMADEPGMSGIPADNKRLIDKPNDQDIEEEVTTMTLEELKEKFPDTYNKIMALGLADGVTQGVEQERARVKMLTEMRATFPKPHSQKVIDQAIMDGHDLSQMTINLMSADQAAAQVDAATADGAIPPAQGAEEDVPEMQDGVMTHQDHLDAVGAQTATLPGVMS